MLGCALGSLSSVDAQVNLGFEMQSPAVDRSTVRSDVPAVPGWQTRNQNMIVAVDAVTARTGAKSLRVENGGGGGRSGFSQTLDARAATGDRIRVSAYVRAGPGSNGAGSLRIRIDGDGRLLYIRRERAVDPADPNGWRRIVIEAPIAARAQRINFGGELTGPGVAWFDDFSVETFPARDLPPPSAVATRYVERALAIIDEHAVTRAALDWPAYRAAVLEQARGAVTIADAHLAVQFALSELGDGHSYFMSPRQMNNLAGPPVGNARTARAPIAPRAQLIAGRFGYLRLPGIAGGEHGDRVAFAETVQALIAEVDPSADCGWILDLRDNQGGNVWPMLAGVGPLLGDGQVASSVQPGGEPRSLWYEDGKAGLGDYVQLRVRGSPYRLRRPDAPVAVLLNDETASAAEIVALAFMGRPKSRSFGTPTDGAGTATRTFPLSDGAALMLAVASLADRGGRVLRGAIEPDETVAEAPRGQALDEQEIIKASSRWLVSQQPGPAQLACEAGDAAVSVHDTRRGDDPP